ncbi:MAG: hypothetical protein AAGE76_01525 [Pseudomonadota bacterium]
MFKRILSAAMIFGVAAIAPPAEAQNAPGRAVCGDRTTIAARLTQRFGETLASTGLTKGQLVEVWRSPTKGNWTVLMTRPNGVSCIMASGRFWTEDGTALPVSSDQG